MSRVTVRITVTGRVQGVSFRAVMKEKASHHKVDGWVRNKADGSVEALLQGEEKDVRRVVEWSRLGPPRALVSGVTEERKEGHPKQSGFRIAE